MSEKNKEIEIKSKKYLSSENPWKLVVRIVAPFLFFMVIESIYLLLDNLIIAYFTEKNGYWKARGFTNNPTTAIFGATTPIRIIAVSVAFLTVVGNAINYSKELALNNVKKASLSLNKGFSSSIVITLSFQLVMIAMSYPILESIFKLNKDLQPHLVDTLSNEAFLYLVATLMPIVIAVSNQNMIRVLNLEGNQNTTAIITVSAAIPKILFTLLFSSVLNLGILSNAYSMIIMDSVVFIILLSFTLHKRRKKQTNLFLGHWKTYLPSKEFLIPIIIAGIPAFARRISTSVTSLVNTLSWSSNGYSDMTGVLSRVQMLLLFASISFTQTLTPVLSYNYKKNENERCNKIIIVAFVYLFSFSLVMILAFIGASNAFLNAFQVVKQPDGSISPNRVIILIMFMFSILAVTAKYPVFSMFAALGQKWKSILFSALESLGFVLSYGIVMNVIKGDANIIPTLGTLIGLQVLLSIGTYVYAFRKPLQEKMILQMQKK